ncbi:hypothetical protein CH63R_04844 [Colletotrichum higginsianum IMI 349063]|uniref:Uncharacterized protein n=1 Tax=Colletotrichum higginsianum (strain IMI 349063) TaxID=759273 RepID=A0A1B7YKY0_COLHI|nr:hypothetical protein CH63R_04844 [Colletotrichum higginsianum IMI 349063]OBR12548.1 hypothetical protein CH63R_04844 [Colletotrichum higginsianum IMI 349063]
MKHIASIIGNPSLALLDPSVFSVAAAAYTAVNERCTSILGHPPCQLFTPKLGPASRTCSRLPFPPPSHPVVRWLAAPLLLSIHHTQYSVTQSHDHGPATAAASQLAPVDPPIELCHARANYNSIRTATAVFWNACQWPPSVTGAVDDTPYVTPDPALCPAIPRLNCLLLTYIAFSIQAGLSSA